MARKKRKGVKGMTPAQEAARLANLEKAKGALESPAEYVPPDEGVDGPLADMQHVYRNAHTAHDKTGGQKAMRLFLDRNPQAFVSQMTTLKADHDVKMGKVVCGGSSAGPVEVDEGTERCVELCVKLLKEMDNDGDGKRSS